MQLMWQNVWTIEEIDKCQLGFKLYQSLAIIWPKLWTSSTYQQIKESMTYIQNCQHIPKDKRKTLWNEGDSTGISNNDIAKCDYPLKLFFS